MNNSVCKPWPQIAAGAYAAYRASTGDPMPRWDELPSAIKTAWEAAVRHAADIAPMRAKDDASHWAGWVSPNHKPATGEQ